MGLFDTNLLTGHVRILTRWEKKRQAVPDPPQGGTDDRLKEASVLVQSDQHGNLSVDDVTLTDERYIIVQIMRPNLFSVGDNPTNIGITFDLATLWPQGLPEGISYYMIMNQTGQDLNIVLDAEPLFRPADTVVKSGSCREASLYVSETGHVLTISDDLTAL